MPVDQVGKYVSRAAALPLTPQHLERHQRADVTPMLEQYTDICEYPCTMSSCGKQHFGFSNQDGFAADDRIEHVGVHVCAVGPADRAQVWVYVHLLEVVMDAERSEHPREIDQLGYIHVTLYAILETQKSW